MDFTALTDQEILNLIEAGQRELESRKNAGKSPIVVEFRCEEPFHVCVECRGDCRPGGFIRHRSHCSTPKAQPEEKKVSVAKKGVSAAKLKELARNGEIAHAGLTEDEIAGSVSCGLISMSEAMNRDF